MPFTLIFGKIVKLFSITNSIEEEEKNIKKLKSEGNR